LALDRRVVELCTHMPGLEHYERPEYLDRLEILREHGWLLGRAMYTLPMNWANLVRAIATIALLVSVHPLFLLLPLFALPSVFAETISESKILRAEERTAENLRRARHLLELSVREDAGKEIRVFGLQEWILLSHRQLWQSIRSFLRRARWFATGISEAGWLSFSMGFTAAIAFTAWRVFSGESSIGDLIMVLTLGAQVNRDMLTLVYIMMWIQRTSRLASHLVWLQEHTGRKMSLSKGSALPPSCIQRGIFFEGVSFRYPGTNRWVLRNIDLTIPAGTKVAVVGENGVGKTTLVKLLCRFYEPTEGRILIDERNLADLDRGLWYSNITAAFQDFFRFQFRVQESVGIGDLSRLNDGAAIRRALDRAEASELEARLPMGLDTQLGATWEKGYEPSVGQWQKLALARTMMRDSPLLIILDEPTGSLDPQTEHALYARQSELASPAKNGAITLLVSHRFATVDMADFIVVIQDGRIAEQGSHSELMAEGGLYASLYSLQAKAYRKDKL
jgi:ATP-binding cassette subfamily B protein